MKEIEVNNGRKIVLDGNKNGMEVVTVDGKNGIENSYSIPDYEMVMLLNYYRNCKSGIEKSDYITEGKIINTNVINADGTKEYL